MKDLYDVVIVGGGPAGAAAGVYCARKRLKTLLITESFGGQSVVSDSIENWIGEKSISGIGLALKFENHVRVYDDVVDVKMPESVAKIEPVNDDETNKKEVCNFKILTKKGNVYFGKTVILGIGARRKKLGIPGEKEFESKGIVYCSTCDAPLFKGMEVAVVGGGNAALEAVIDLFPYASKIHLLHRSEALRGDPIIRKTVEENKKVTISLNTKLKEIIGNKMVTGVIFENKEGKERKIDVQGVFVEIGSVPNSDPVKELVEVDEWGQVKTNPKTGETSCPGVFAAGDITDGLYKQNNIAAGDAVKAALSAYNYIQQKKK